MTDKRSKKNTTKNNKNTTKNKGILKLKLDNGVEIPAETAYAKATKYFKINDIDIDKIRVSDKKLYNKEHNSYKYYVFYGHSNEYIPLRIILKDFAGYYDDSLLKIISIFEYIEEKLGIDLGSYFYGDKRREKYLILQMCLRKYSLKIV